MEEGMEESNSSKVAAAKLAGVGRDRQAKERAIRVSPERGSGERWGERCERGESRLGRFD
jgi:hypothetical protein